MKARAFWMSGLLLLFLSSQALALNVRVREVRRVRVDQAMTFVYEVENASVDRVRFHRVEAHFFDGEGRRVELQRPVLDLNPMRPGDVTFLQVRLGAEVHPLAGEILLKLLVSRDLDFPILEPRQPQQLEFRFPLTGELRKVHAPRQAPRLRLQSIGFVERPGHPARFLVYRVTNEGPEAIQGALELRYIGQGRLLPFEWSLVLQRLSAGEERVIQVEVPKDDASLPEGLEVKAVLDGEGDFEPTTARPVVQEAVTGRWVRSQGQIRAVPNAQK